MTPVGWRVAVAGLEAAVRGTGLELSIGSLSGNLLRRVTIEDVALREPGGRTIATIDRIEAEFAFGGLVRRHIVIPKLRVTGAELLFVVGPDGKLIGWSRFAPEPEPGASRDGPRAARGPSTSRSTCRSSSVAFRDSAAGLAVEADGVTVEGRGGPIELPGVRGRGDRPSRPRRSGASLPAGSPSPLSGADGRITHRVRRGS